VKPRSSLLVGGFYFLLLTIAFFAFVRWMSQPGNNTLQWSQKEKIALVRLEGMIVDSEGVIDELRQYRDDDRIKAIILFIDSPGGPVVPAQEIHEEVLKTKAVKKVVTSMGNVAASGGITSPARPTGSSPIRARLPAASG
jgi:protease-4